MTYFDYYTKINNTYNTKYTIKSNLKKDYSSFAIIRRKIDGQLNNLLKNRNIPEFNQIQKYKNVNEHYPMITQILLEIKQINTYNTSMDLIKHFIIYGHNLPFRISTDLNPYNPSENVLTITDNSLSLYNNLYSNKKMLYNYKCLLNTIFIEVFGKNHKWDITKIINIEKKLCSYQLNENDMHNIINNLKLYRVSEIKHIGLDLQEIFPSILTNSYDKILTPNIKGLQLMLSYIKTNWNTPDWKIYWIYQLIKTYVKCIPNLIKVIYKFNNVNLNQDIQPELLYFTEWIPYKLNYYYYKYYKNVNEIEFCTKLSIKYIKTYIHKIQKNGWMSPATKQLCISKLLKLKFIIGYDNNWNTHLNESSPTILQNILTSNTKNYNELMHNITHTSYRNNASYLVNAFYIIDQNIIYIPNGILQPPFVDMTKSMVYNLACLGNIIGHEISHCIDLDGLYYNEDNIYNKNTWLSENEVKIYKSLQNNIIHYLEHMYKTDKININGSLYISETISDITGLLLSEYILLDYLKEHSLPIIQNLHKFYRHYTKLWKNTKSIKQKLLSSYGDFHMFEKYRINCALISSINFRNLYTIKKVYENIL